MCYFRICIVLSLTSTEVGTSIRLVRKSQRSKNDYFGKVWTLELHLAAPCRGLRQSRQNWDLFSLPLVASHQGVDFLSRGFLDCLLLHVFLQNLRVRRVDCRPAIQIQVEPINSNQISYLMALFTSQDDIKAHTRQSSKCWIHTPLFLPRLLPLPRAYCVKNILTGWLVGTSLSCFAWNSVPSSHTHTCALEEPEGRALEEQKCSRHAGNQESGE